MQKVNVHNLKYLMLFSVQFYAIVNMFNTTFIIGYTMYQKLKLIYDFFYFILRFEE